MRDSDPDSADIDHFDLVDDQSIECHQCGATFWDGLDQCPKCEAEVRWGKRSTNSPEARKQILIIAVLMAIALSGILGLLRLFGML